MFHQTLSFGQHLDSVRHDWFRPTWCWFNQTKLKMTRWCKQNLYLTTNVDSYSSGHKTQKSVSPQVLIKFEFVSEILSILISIDSVRHDDIFHHNKKRKVLNLDIMSCIITWGHLCCLGKKLYLHELWNKNGYSFFYQIPSDMIWGL